MTKLWNALVLVQFPMPSHASQFVAAPRSVVSASVSAVARRWTILLAPLALALAVMLLFGATSLDVLLARQFYGDVANPWPQAAASHWLALYQWGLVPAWIVGIGALSALTASLWMKSFRPYRRALLFVALCLILGPGIIVNGVLKPMWGRPRPYQITEFGGKQSYEIVARPGGFVRGKSFPSGHAAMGYYLIVPALLATRWGRGSRSQSTGCVPFLWTDDKRLGRKRRRMWIACWLAAGLTLGLAMSFGRIAQGGHFASDVVGSAVCVYGAALLLAPWVLASRPRGVHSVAAADESPRQRVATRRAA